MKIEYQIHRHVPKIKQIQNKRKVKMEEKEKLEIWREKIRKYD